MPEPPYQRPQGFRFEFRGVNLADTPDAMADGKYASALNIRTTGSNSIRTRPGYVPYFTGGNSYISDLRAYTGNNTDSLPRLLARDGNGQVWLDNNVNVGNMNGASYGASMLPFRPAQSPVSWMYIGSTGDYRKFSAPNANNNVTNYKVGIQEPQNQVEAAPRRILNVDFTGNENDWTQGGTAGAPFDITRSNNNIGAAVFQDPALAGRYFASVVPGPAYSAGETVSIAGNTVTPIEQVIPALTSNNVFIQEIRYYNSNFLANNGPCIIVPSQTPTQDSPYGQLSSLQRGSIVTLAGNENVLVYDVIRGPSGIIAFETSTNNTHASGEIISGLPSIVLNGPAVAANATVIATGIEFASNNGIGYVSRAFSVSPFLTNMGNNTLPQQDDYIHCSLLVSDPTKLTEVQIQFDVSVSGNNFTGDMYYYAVRPGDVVGVVGDTITQQQALQQAIQNSILDQIQQLANTGASNEEIQALYNQLQEIANITPPGQSSAGQNQWTEVLFPISSMTRVGTDQSRTLANCAGMRIKVNANDNVSIQFGSIWTGGGGQPDIGNNGVPYTYRVVPLSSLTGVRGNPNPPTRYGVSPRRQSVVVKTSSLNSSYDSQIDTWEIYRYGGSVTSFRYIGSAPVGTDFIDNYFDDSAQKGETLPINNTEPWPSIDAPWRATSANFLIFAYGSLVLVSQTGAIPLPTNLSRWLPGTLLQLGANQTAVLRERPFVAGNNGYVFFTTEETIGQGNQTQITVLEPNVARQTLPYLWGPSEEGFFFGCGDPLRPGTLSWSKPYGPDSSPTAYNLELCPPSEPLLGGEIMRGISVCASSKRWWAIYYQQGGEPMFTKVEIPIGAPLAAPFGKCTDGKMLYYWSKDGIYATDVQSPAKSLTDADLYNLFPHGGLAGETVVRNGVTYYAPDYSKIGGFRLAVRDDILYADYRDVNSLPRTLVCLLDTGAWLQDTYNDPMTVHYSIEQPVATMTASPALYPTVIGGGLAGRVWKFQDLHNDDNAVIPALVATSQRNGGDDRAQSWWGDQYVDVAAPNGMNVTPFSLGNNVAAATAIAANNSRQFVPVSLGGGVLQRFMGLQLSWSDNFAASNMATTLYVWQPSFVDKPETITNRYGDWDDFGGASYIRGFKMRADTNNANKIIAIRNSDDNNTYTFAGGPANNTIIHSGEQEKAYYFPTPFVSHMARYEPGDNNSWRYFGMEWLKDVWPEMSGLVSPWLNLGTPEAKFFQGCVIPMDTGGNSVSIAINGTDGTSVSVSASTPAGVKTPVAFPGANNNWAPFITHEIQLVPSAPVRIWWDEIVWIWEATPEVVTTWETQWTALGAKGYKHVPRIEAAYSSNNNVTLSIQSFDGQSANNITLASTGGVMKRFLMTLTPNKGQLYKFSATSAGRFQIFQNDWVVWVNIWGNPGAPTPWTGLGREFGDKARI